MLRFRFSHLIAWLFVVSSLVQAAEPAGRDVAAAALVTFPISTEGGRLLLPVKIEDKTYRFILDTGVGISVFDRGLPLGRLKRSATGKGAGGDSTTIEIREAPAAKIGPLALDCPDGVVVVEFSRFAPTVGDDVHGLIGMDFLHRHILQLDFDAGELRFFKALPSQAGSRFHMASSKGKLPHLLFQIGSHKDKLLALDTGLMTFGSGSLAPDEFARLLTTGELKITGRGLSPNVSGTVTTREGRAKSLMLGDFEVVAPVFDEGGRNKVGLNFLRRFVATIDFPDEKLYLKKGKRYTEADVWNLSGLAVIRKDGNFVIVSVEQDGVAARAGLEEGASILKFDGQDPDGLTLEEIRRRCCNPGTLSLRVDRLGTIKDVKLELTR